MGPSGQTEDPEGRKGGVSGSGGRIRDGRGETRSEVGEARRKTVETSTTAATESGRKRAMEDPPVRNSKNRAWGKYRISGGGQE